MLMMMKHNVLLLQQIPSFRLQQIIIARLQNVLHADLVEHLSVEVAFNYQTAEFSFLE